MATERTISINIWRAAGAKLGDVAQLFKLRLGSLVVFSSVIGYLIASAGSVNWQALLILSFGGMLVTGASNALNQIFEKDIDILMDRTKNRPIPAGRMSASEAALWAGLAAVGGLSLISFYFNPVAGSLSALALISYAFIYTPMKRMTSFAVFVGAIPGALPPMIGAVAFDGNITYMAALLFAFQFIWQFPHFWAIAWVAFDDYKKAGIMLLPAADGRSKSSALISLIYTSFLIPMAFVPWVFGTIGFVAAMVIALSGAYFLYMAYLLYRDCSVKSARKLMFASFFYLPVVLLALLTGLI